VSTDRKLDDAQRAAARPINGNLLATGEGDDRVLACRKCGTVLCGYSDSYKDSVLVDRGSATEIPLVQDPNRYHDVAMEFRRYCCPGCQVLLTTEVVRADEPILREMRLA
jgi:N-methylhydantoinase B